MIYLNTFVKFNESVDKLRHLNPVVAKLNHAYYKLGIKFSDQSALTTDNKASTGCEIYVNSDIIDDSIIDILAKTCTEKGSIWIHPTMQKTGIEHKWVMLIEIFPCTVWRQLADYTKREIIDVSNEEEAFNKIIEILINFYKPTLWQVVDKENKHDIGKPFELTYINNIIISYLKKEPISDSDALIFFNKICQSETPSLFFSLIETEHIDIWNIFKKINEDPMKVSSKLGQIGF